METSGTKLAHTFSHASHGTQFVKIGQVIETGPSFERNREDNTILFLSTSTHLEPLEQRLEITISKLTDI